MIERSDSRDQGRDIGGEGLFLTGLGSSKWVQGFMSTCQALVAAGIIFASNPSPALGKAPGAPAGESQRAGFNFPGLSQIESAAYLKEVIDVIKGVPSNALYSVLTAFFLFWWMRRTDREERKGNLQTLLLSTTTLINNVVAGAPLGEVTERAIFGNLVGVLDKSKARLSAERGPLDSSLSKKKADLREILSFTAPEVDRIRIFLGELFRTTTLEAFSRPGLRTESIRHYAVFADEILPAGTKQRRARFLLFQESVLDSVAGVMREVERDMKPAPNDFQTMRGLQTFYDAVQAKFGTLPGRAKDINRIKVAFEINLERWAAERATLFGVPVRSFWAPEDLLAKYVTIDLDLPVGEGREEIAAAQIAGRVMEISVSGDT